MVEQQYQQLKTLEKQSMPKSDAHSSHRRLHSLYDSKTFSGLDLILQK